jgi:hypothetical protein
VKRLSKLQGPQQKKRKFVLPVKEETYQQAAKGVKLSKYVL